MVRRQGRIGTHEEERASAGNFPGQIAGPGREPVVTTGLSLFSEIELHAVPNDENHGLVHEGLAGDVGVAELHDGLESEVRLDSITRRIPVVGGCAVLKVPDAALLLESARTVPTVETAAGEGIGAAWARRDSNARPLAPERRPDHQPPSAGVDSP